MRCDGFARSALPNHFGCVGVPAPAEARGPSQRVGRAGAPGAARMGRGVGEGGKLI